MPLGANVPDFLGGACRAAGKRGVRLACLTADASGTIRMRGGCRLMATGETEKWRAPAPVADTADAASAEGVSDDDKPESGQESLSGYVETVVYTADKESVSVGEIVEAEQNVSLLPLLMLPAVALVSPLSGIPLFSSTMGIMIFLVSLQIVAGRRTVWLPRWIRNLWADGHHVQSAFNWVKPLTRWLDAHTNPRLRGLSRMPLVLVPQVLCLFSGLIIPFLELVPFSSSLIGLGVTLLALGMLARDGVILLLATIPYVAAGWIIFTIAS